jgi:hypothetical protein
MKDPNRMNTPALVSCAGAERVRTEFRNHWHRPDARGRPDSRTEPPAFFSDVEQRALSGFAPVSPELLAARELLSRSDTKFLLRRSALAASLQRLSAEYALLLSGHDPSARYLTEYFDTPQLSLFHAHRRGRRIRHKVRCRHYLDRGVSFLEIKAKGIPGLTHKRRRPLGFLENDLSAADRTFITNGSPVDGTALLPTVVNQFQRITLVGIRTRERVTIDLDLHFRDDGSSHDLGDTLIVEIKQERLKRRSSAICALRACGAQAAKPSKYCLGALLLNPELRSNRLRPLLSDMKRFTRA